MLGRLVRFLSRGRLAREFDREIADHIALLRERFERRGMRPEQAAAEARRQFGGVAQLREQQREHAGFPRLENLVQDARYGARALLNSRGYTAVAVLSLALGIGANTAIYSVINAVMLRALPVADPERLAVISIPFVQKGEVRYGRSFSYPQYRDLRDRNQSMEGVIAFHEHPMNVRVGNDTSRVNGVLVSGNYFGVLGVRPELGTAIGPEDDRIPGSGGPRGPVVVVSHRFWTQRLGGGAAFIGQSIEVNGTPFSIVGVAPEAFSGTEVGSAPDIFAPIAMQSVLAPENANALERRRNVWLRLVGRMRAGEDPRQAEADLTLLLQQFNQADLGRSDLTELRRRALREQRIVLEPGATGLSGLRRTQGPLLRILMAVVVVILLISCANIANLTLARAAGREREISVRLALGASRSRVFSLLLTESLLLAMGGTMVGMVLARWGRDLLVRVLLPTQNLDVSLDPRVLTFSAAIGITAGLLFGFGPALQSGRMAWGRTPGPSAGRVRAALVSTQVGLSVLLLIGAGLFLRTLLNLRSLDPGFTRQNLVLAEADPGLNGYTRQRTNALYRDLLEAARSLPGVTAATLADNSPLDNHTFWNLTEVTGRPPRPNESMDAQITRVAPGYFEAMGIPILLGRDIGEQDTSSVASVALVNQTFVRQYVPDGLPIGKRIYIGNGDPGIEIVGVAQDSRYTGLRGPVERMLYVPYVQQRPFGGMVVHARVAGNPAPVIAALRREMRRLDPHVPLYNLHTIEEQIDRALAGENLMATVAVLFGILALVLSSGGIYGVMSYAVSRRTREVGIRMALGAESGAILRLMLRDAGFLIGAGMAAGVPAAYALGRLAESRFYGVTPGDTASIAAAMCALAGAGFAAAWLPARRAARVDPMAALRIE
jgi:predicted permease